MGDKVKKNSSTPYDDAFRTLTVDCPRLLIPVINEVFDKHYTGDEEIVFHPNEHFMDQQDGAQDKIITDSSFSIIGETEEKYLFECQSTPDSSMLVRIFQYMTQEALVSGEITSARLTVTIPNAAILFLRHSRKTPDVMTIEMKTPGGDVEFQVPVMKIRNYTLDSIFKKKLYFLLPFYIFTQEKKLKKCNEDPEQMKELTGQFVSMRERLDQAVENGDLSVYYRRVIVDMTKKVLESIARRYANVKREVGEIMGGKVLEHEGKTIFNAGREKGRAEGRAEGRVEGKLNEKQETALSLHEMGMNVDFIAKAVRVSTELVKQWISSTNAATL